MSLFLLCFALLGACASREPLDPAYFEIEPGRLPSADVSLNIPGLGPCTDNPDRTLRLNSSQPVNVLVHGCFGSSGQFRGLAQVLAFHGQQSACFTCDDRAVLTRSATELRRAVNQLAEQTRSPQITVIGHSQGALVSNYLKIDTDERGSCRREKDGRCLEDDDVFSLTEQRNSLVETDSRTQRVEARADHVEIVGDKRVSPMKLITILQDQGV
ncbi:MAG: hypothetical protein Q7T78_23955, partial [Rhodoferax sp.]|nr:hypothetical protein [Rhodoferax sp.]